jgi:hypothetical protein
MTEKVQQDHTAAPARPSVDSENNQIPVGEQEVVETVEGQDESFTSSTVSTSTRRQVPGWSLVSDDPMTRSSPRLSIRNIPYRTGSLQ